MNINFRLGCTNQNKLMKTLFSTLVALFLVAFTFAQTTGQIANYGSSAVSGAENAAQINALLGPMTDAKEKTTVDLDNIQGSPYTSNVFIPTQLYYKDENYGTMFYRYNAYNEEIEIKQQNLENEGIRALGRDKNLFIMVNGNPMSFKTFIDKKGLTQNGYLTLLSDGEYKFYKRVDVKYTEGQKAQNSFVKAIPPRFSQFTEYYLEVPGVNRIDELELSNRKLIKLLPADKQELVKSYLKENKIKVKDEADVIAVLKWLEQQ